MTRLSIDGVFQNTSQKIEHFSYKERVKTLFLNYRQKLSGKIQPLHIQLLIILLINCFIFWEYHLQTTSQYINPKISSQGNKYLSVASPKDKTVTSYKQCALTIQKIQIANVPIALNVDSKNSKNYLSVLQNGVAHMQGTALPGNYGNSVIFGHSSYFPWSKGDYKRVFAKLNNLQPKDEIKVVCDSRVMNFAVQKKRIIKPQEISVLNKSGGDFLTLLTCWPPGTVAKRLLVTAKEI